MVSSGKVFSVEDEEGEVAFVFAARGLGRPRRMYCIGS